MEPSNRKLIRPSFNEAKGQRPPKPRGGPRQASPPEQTNAENFYYLKQMQSKVSMSIVLRDGEFEGRHRMVRQGLPEGEPRRRTKSGGV
jgi:hypothetical protein